MNIMTISIQLTEAQYKTLLAAMHDAGFADVSSFVTMAALRRAAQVLAGE